MSRIEMEQMLSISRPNVLVRATDEVIDAALPHITQWIAEPLHVYRPPDTGSLPMQTGGALLIRDVAALDAQQQAGLMDWLDVHAGSVQVISATTTDLFAAVERGTFSGRLYYRLNTILAEIGVTGELQPWAV